MAVVPDALQANATEEQRSIWAQGPPSTRACSTPWCSSSRRCSACVMLVNYKGRPFMMGASRTTLLCPRVHGGGRLVCAFEAAVAQQVAAAGPCRTTLQVQNPGVLAVTCSAPRVGSNHAPVAPTSSSMPTEIPSTRSEARGLAKPAKKVIRCVKVHFYFVHPRPRITVLLVGAFTRCAPSGGRDRAGER